MIALNSLDCNILHRTRNNLICCENGKYVIQVAPRKQDVVKDIEAKEEMTSVIDDMEAIISSAAPLPYEPPITTRCQ